MRSIMKSIFRWKCKECMFIGSFERIWNGKKERYEVFCPMCKAKRLL